MRDINFYRTEKGDCPVEDFLDSLSSKQAQKVAWVLNLIEEQPVVSTRYFKKLINSDDIWEVRVVFGSNIFRILGFIDREKSSYSIMPSEKRLRRLHPEQSR